VGGMSSFVRTLVVAVTMAALTALAGCGGEEGSMDDGVAEDSPQLTAEEAAARACPDPVPAAKDLSGPTTLPPGPLAIRLCPGPAPGTPATVPDEALTTGTDEIVRMINDSPESDPMERCTMDMGPSYGLQATYADGSSVLVIGEMFGCKHLFTGSMSRSGDAKKVFDRVVELIDQQP